MLDKERENYKQKLRETEGKGTRVEAKQTELMLNFEKEKAKWEHEKGYLAFPERRRYGTLAKTRKESRKLTERK